MDELIFSEDWEKRKRKYKKYLKLYSGEHFEYWEKADDLIEEREDYITVNYISKVIDSIVNIVLSENPHFMVQSDNTQEYLDSIIFDSDFLGKLKEAVKSGLINGDIVYRVVRNENLGITVPDFVHPQFYDPIFDLWDKTKIVSNRLIFLNKDEEGKEIARVELDNWNKFEERYYRKNDNGYWVEDLSKRKVIPHDQGYLIYHIKLNHLPFEQFGVSSIEELIDLQRAINRLYTMIFTVLRKHHNPKLAIPQSMYNDLKELGGEERVNSNGELVIRWESFDFVVVDPTVDGNVKPEYIVWDASLEAGFKHLDRLLIALSVISDVASDVLRTTDTKLPQSGTAKKLESMASIYRAKEIGELLKRPLEKALYQSMVLENKVSNNLKGINPEWVTVNFNYSIPVDEKEIELEIEKYKSGLQSRETTIRKLNRNLNQRQVLEEIKRIDEDNARNNNDTGSRTGSEG